MTDKAKQSLSRSQRRISHPTFPGRGTARYTGQAGELNIGNKMKKAIIGSLALVMYVNLVPYGQIWGHFTYFNL